MTIRPIFAWYDLWIGAYWDRANRRLYLMVPMVGLVLDFGEPPDALEARYYAECAKHCRCCPCCQDVPCSGAATSGFCDGFDCVHDDDFDERYVMELERAGIEVDDFARGGVEGRDVLF